jgi:hypothetical protein
VSFVADVPTGGEKFSDDDPGNGDDVIVESETTT